MTVPTSQRVSLGELGVEVVRGVVPAKPTDGDDGVPFFGLSEISSGGATAPRLVAKDDVKPGAPRLVVGDVAVALMSNIGASALVTPRHAGAVLGRECVALRVRGPELSGAWIYVWTQSADFHDQVQRHISGTTMPRLNVRGLAGLTLPLPSRDLQTRAEGMLDDFDHALANAGQVLSDLTELRRIELELMLKDAESNPMIPTSRAHGVRTRPARPGGRR